MQTSESWTSYFKLNLQKQRVDWSIAPSLTADERKTILKSLQAWQLGETSDGAHLKAAAKRYADRIGDNYYCEAVRLFIIEEQKHGNNLGLYLDAIDEKRVQNDWGDTLFRRIRYFNTSMELWTLAVITVESTAQIFYQSLKDATECKLLRQICTDILIDEAAHIRFQQERMQIIFANKSVMERIASYQFYRLFYFATITVVWMAHGKVLSAGGNGIIRYWKKMHSKFRKNFTPLLQLPLNATQHRLAGH